MSSQGNLAYFRRRGQAIVAVATGKKSPIGVIRISGENLGFLAELLGPLPMANSFHYKKIGNIDRALVLNFESPHSFTGENVVEIQGHGVPALLETLLERVAALGALKALPGEFSFRAVLNNKMTLDEAEKLNMALSHDDLSAEWASELMDLDHTAEKNLRLRLSESLTWISKARGRIEAAIDYPEAEAEQESEILGAGELLALCKRSMVEVLTAFENYSKAFGENRVVIVGPTNVGKSTLLNILAASERSIVSAESGTTRDYIETRFKISEGSSFRVFDTAGFRDEEGSSIESSVERDGIERSLNLAKTADLLIFLSKPGDLGQGFWRKQMESLEVPVLEMQSHADQCDQRESHCFDLRREKREVLDHLHDRLSRFVQNRKREKSLGLVSSRQAALIGAAIGEINAALISLKGDRPIELAAENTREAETKLRLAIGQNLSEEYIGEIFSQFCLGK